jgi:hypothetical protein
MAMTASAVFQGRNNYFGGVRKVTASSHLSHLREESLASAVNVFQIKLLHFHSKPRKLRHAFVLPCHKKPSQNAIQEGSNSQSEPGHTHSLVVLLAVQDAQNRKEEVEDVEVEADARGDLLLLYIKQVSAIAQSS